MTKCILVNAERTPIRLLMSTGGEEAIAKTMTMILQKALGPTYEVIPKEIPTASKFLEAADTEPVDLFVIMLNNMFPDATKMFPDTSKPDQALKIITYLKDKYRKPVIAMAGWWPEGMNIQEEANKAGSDYFFVWPPDYRQTGANLLRCLGVEVKESLLYPIAIAPKRMRHLLEPYVHRASVFVQRVRNAWGVLRWHLVGTRDHRQGPLFPRLLAVFGVAQAKPSFFVYAHSQCAETLRQSILSLGDVIDTERTREFEPNEFIGRYPDITHCDQCRGEFKPGDSKYVRVCILERED